MIITVAIIPPIFILVLTLIISLVTGHPEDLFLARSTNSILIRFVLATPVLAVSIVFVPKLLDLVVNMAKDHTLFGQFVRTKVIPIRELSAPVDLVLRPLQGMALSLIFAERFLEFFEQSTVTTFIGILVRTTIFALLMFNPLISLFLSFVWALDDLGIMIYNRNTGELRMLSSSVGIILPLIVGVIGIFNIFHRTSFIPAIIDLFGVFMVLYPPYVLLAIAHHEYLKIRNVTLSKTIPLERIVGVHESSLVT